MPYHNPGMMFNNSQQPPILPPNVRPQNLILRKPPIPMNQQAPRAIMPPRPFVPPNRTRVDRILDFLVGDGPSNRYALICRRCNSHNGMALKEEFEFISFNCCYCSFFNPGD